MTVDDENNQQDADGAVLPSSDAALDQQTDADRVVAVGEDTIAQTDHASATHLSTYLNLVNDPSIVVLRRSVAPHAPLKWIAHNVLNVLGYRGELLLSKEFGYEDAWAALVQRNSLGRYQEFTSRLLDNDRAGCLYQILAADGSYRFVREEARVVRNNDEEPIDIVGCLIDWTSLTPLQTEFTGSAAMVDDVALTRQYRMRELELVADLMAAHCNIRQQSRAYRDVVQTLKQLTERLRQQADARDLSRQTHVARDDGRTIRREADSQSDAMRFDGEQVPIGVYVAHPYANRTLARTNAELRRLIGLSAHQSTNITNISGGLEGGEEEGVNLSQITTPDIARTNEETVDVAMRSREDFDLVYPVLAQPGATQDFPGSERDIAELDRVIDDSESAWLRWIWEQGRIEYDDNGQPVAIHGAVADVTESMNSDLQPRDTTGQSRIPFHNSHSSTSLEEANDDFADEGEYFASGHGERERGPLNSDDEVVAVFNASSLLSVDSPTVELRAESAGSYSGANAYTRDATFEPELQLSVSGAEIASWDHGVDGRNVDAASQLDAGATVAGQEEKFDDDTFEDAQVEDMSTGDLANESVSVDGEPNNAEAQESDAVTRCASADDNASGSTTDDPNEEISHGRISNVADDTVDDVRNPNSIRMAESQQWAVRSPGGDTGVDSLDFERFTLFVQPGFSAAARIEVQYVEVLLRIRDGDGVLLKPGDFALRESGVDTQIAIDRWVVERVFDILYESEPASDTLSIAINLSAHTVRDYGFPGFLQERFDATGVEPSRIAFEISGLLDDRGLDDVVAELTKIKATGCQVVLDNFNGEDPIIRKLKAVPVDRIKISGDIIKNIDRYQADHTLVAQICEAARGINVPITAQHVEDLDLLPTLQAFGIDSVQGFALGAPVSIFELN